MWSPCEHPVASPETWKFEWSDVRSNEPVGPAFDAVQQLLEPAHGFEPPGFGHRRPCPSTTAGARLRSKPKTKQVRDAG